MRPAKDDPRLSRGLQLLQSKIAILEDLSDRTDNQFKHLSLLLEEKAKSVQDSIDAAQEQIQQLSNSMQKSHEVARIFQDKIPHEEIIDRQNTVKYVRAAQMAFQGASLEDIESEVDIPRSELEFIVKVNREKLMFNPESLPSWIQYELNAPQAVAAAPIPTPISTPQAAPSTLSQVGDEFRKAVAEMEPFIEKPAVVASVPTPTPVANTKQIISGSAVDKVKPYNFPRIDLRANKHQ